jgi:hypothetical protein
MISLLWLFACAPGPNGDAGPQPAPSPTQGTTAPVDPIDVPRADGPVRMAIQPTVTSELPLVFVSAAVLCEGDEAWLTTEYVGAPERITAKGWRDGAVRVEVELSPMEAGETVAFRTTDTHTDAPSCEQLTWQWELRADERYGCFVTGPDDAVHQQAPEGCVRG